MKTFFICILVLLAPVVIGMLTLRTILFLAVVVPTISKRGIRFWINALFGSTQGHYTDLYLKSLPEKQRMRWPNWYLKYSGILIGAIIVLWCVILLSVR